MHRDQLHQERIALVNHAGAHLHRPVDGMGVPCLVLLLDVLFEPLEQFLLTLLGHRLLVVVTHGQCPFFRVRRNAFKICSSLSASVPTSSPVSLFSSVMPFRNSRRMCRGIEAPAP